MAQTDPIRSQKADRWDQLVASGVAPANATQQVEREFAQRGGESSARTAPRMAAESTTVTGKPFKKRPELTAGEEAKGLARSLAQGATFGFWDELESLPYALPGGEDAQTARTRIRAEMGKYREGSPVLAPMAELTGGLASGFGLAGLAAKGVPLAARVAGSGTAQGFLTGAGSAEGGLTERAAPAAAGAVLGGLFSSLAGKAIGSGVTAAKRGSWSAKPEVGMAEEALESLRETPSQVAIRAGRMAADSPEAKTVDVLGQPGVRQARRIEALGGEAGQDINRSMTQRMDERLQRMADIFPRITGKGREDVGQTINDILTERSIISKPMYERVHRQSVVVSPKLEKFIESRASLQNAEKQAIELAAEDGIELPMIDLGNGQVRPARTPALLDYMKRALDDQVFVGRNPTSGIGKEKLRLINNTRAEFVDMLDMLIPGYQEARNAFAGQTALANAMEDAADLAGRTVQPGEIQRHIQTLKSDSEREFFQRGWLNAQVDKIEAGGLTPKQIRTPLYEKQVTEVFGKDAPSIMDALRTEVELADNANAIIKGSRTTPLAKDVERELGPKWAQTARNTYMTVKNDPTYAIARALDLANEKFRGPTLAAERVRKAAALNTPAAQMGDLLNQVEQEYAARKTGRNVGTRFGTAIGAQGVRSLYDSLR